MSNFAISISQYFSGFSKLHRILRSIYCFHKPGVRYRTEKAFLGFDSIRVLKIGANDGVENDPFGYILRSDNRYTGVLVEPVPEYADALEHNYAGTHRFKVERCAISEDDGEALFYTVDYTTAKKDGIVLEEWLKGCASMDWLHLQKHLPVGCGKYISSAVIQMMSVETLLLKHKIDKVDLLHIDTEGHDYKILRQFDLRALSTSVVLCEKKHLSYEDALAMKKLLFDAGFVIYEDETDYLGVRKII